METYSKPLTYSLRRLKENTASWWSSQVVWATHVGSDRNSEPRCCENSMKRRAGSRGTWLVAKEPTVVSWGRRKECIRGKRRERWRTGSHSTGFLTYFYETLRHGELPEQAHVCTWVVFRGRRDHCSIVSVMRKHAQLLDHCLPTHKLFFYFPLTGEVDRVDQFNHLSSTSDRPQVPTFNWQLLLQLFNDDNLINNNNSLAILWTVLQTIACR